MRFNAQRSRVIIVVVQVGAVKIQVAAVVQALTKKETQDETQFTTKIRGKLVWVPVISFCKIFIPTSAFDAIYDTSVNPVHNAPCLFVMRPGVQAEQA